jgi:hypothetical protein
MSSGSLADLGELGCSPSSSVAGLRSRIENDAAELEGDSSSPRTASVEASTSARLDQPGASSGTAPLPST